MIFSVLILKCIFYLVNNDEENERDWYVNLFYYIIFINFILLNLFDINCKLFDFFENF